MKHDYEYTRNGIILKPLERDDAQLMRVLRNKNKHCFLGQAEITEEMQDKWYDSYLGKEGEIMFTIAKQENPEYFLGAVGLYDIDHEAKICEVGRFLVDRERSKERGIGTRALDAACAFAEHILKMEIVKSVIMKENTRSLAVSQNIGCKIVGEDETSYVLNYLKRREVSLPNNF